MMEFYRTLLTFFGTTRVTANQAEAAVKECVTLRRAGRLVRPSTAHCWAAFLLLCTCTRSTIAAS